MNLVPPLLLYCSWKLIIGTVLREKVIITVLELWLVALFYLKFYVYCLSDSLGGIRVAKTHYIHYSLVFLIYNTNGLSWGTNL